MVNGAGSHAAPVQAAVPAMVPPTQQVRTAKIQLQIVVSFFKLELITFFAL